MVLYSFDSRVVRIPINRYALYKVVSCPSLLKLDTVQFEAVAQYPFWISLGLFVAFQLCGSLCVGRSVRQAAKRKATRFMPVNITTYDHKPPDNQCIYITCTCFI